MKMIFLVFLVVFCGCQSRVVVVDPVSQDRIEIREKDLDVFLRMSRRVEIKRDLDGDDVLRDGAVFP